MSANGPQVFISYQRTDGDFARQVREHLVAAGVRTWMDQDDIPVGAYWPDEIDRGLAASDIVVGILSPDAVQSRNVKNEWDWALSHDTPLLLLQVRACDVPHRYGSINFIEASARNPQPALDALLARLGIQTPERERPPDGLEWPSILPAAVTIMSPRYPSAPLIVGRDREQAQFQHHLDDVLSGHGRLALVGGEAGIGKTTLVNWLGWCAEQASMVALFGGCYDLSMTCPYGPWVEALQSWPTDAGLPALPHALRNGIDLGHVRSQAQLFDLVGSLLREASDIRPLLLVLEDLHWADQASLDLLQYTNQVVETQRILLVATYRDDELTRRHPLYQLLPRLSRAASTRRLALGRLDEDATRTLVSTQYPGSDDALDPLVEYVHRIAEGNPFFAGEILRALVETGVLVASGSGWQVEQLAHVRVPELVRQVVDGRLTHIGDDARQHLEVAAVIGHEVPLDLWVAVSGVDEGLLSETLERATEAHLIDELRDGSGYRFTHALIRETLYEGLTQLRRRVIHRRAGAMLELSEQADPDAVANYFQLGRDPRAYAWLIRAAERAEASFAAEAAAARYDAALELLDDSAPSDRARARLLYQIGFVTRYVRQYSGRNYAAEARDLARHIGDEAVEAVAVFEVGARRLWAGDANAGFADMRRGVDLFDTLTLLDQARMIGRPGITPTGPLVNDNRGMLISISNLAGKVRDTVAMGRAFVAALPDDPMLALGPTRTRWADGLMGTACLLAQAGDIPAAQELFRRSQDTFRRSGDHHMLSQSIDAELEWLMNVYFTDRMAARRRLVAERDEAARRNLQDNEHLFATADVAFNSTFIIDGAWDRSLRGNILMRDHFVPFWRIWFAAQIAEIQYYRGARQLVNDILQDYLPDGPLTTPNGNLLFEGVVRLQRIGASIALDAGDSTTARAWLDARQHWLDWAGVVPHHADNQLGMARMHRALGDLVAAETCARDALLLASEPRQPLALLAAHRSLGELCTATARRGEADHHLLVSLTLADACAAPYERALTLLATGELRLAQSDVSAARTLLAEARAICEPLEARPTLERVTTLEAQLEPVSTPTGSDTV